MNTLYRTMLVCIVLLISTFGASYAQQQINDKTITRHIENQFYNNASLSAQMVDIETKDGIVTLCGKVSDLITKERLVEISKSIKGVRGVVNNIAINPPAVTDSELKTNIEKALVNDPATDAYEIEVFVNDGVVKLLGEVDSWNEKMLAEDVVKDVGGVIKVKNDIAFVYKEGRPDKEIKSDIVQRLRYDTRVDDGLINVQVDDGKVTMNGTVGSATEKSIAEVNAWVANVKEVDASALKVSPWEDDKKLLRHKYTDIGDMDIHSAINDAFKYDPRVKEFDIQVAVNEGVVTLSGKVDNLMAKNAAKIDAKNIVGVVDVKNLIKVRPEDMIDNKELAARVEQKLLEDPYVGYYNLEVNASNGKVYLKGEVSSIYEKLRANNITSKVKGVVNVENMISVKGLKPHEVEMDVVSYGEEQLITPALNEKEDLKLKREIEKQIWWSPFVDKDDVTIEVENGNVILSGRVDSRKEKEYAELNAVQAGARQIENDLLVQK